jgi:predicted NAD/FAD-dependent oxidoreductase
LEDLIYNKFALNLTEIKKPLFLFDKNNKITKTDKNPLKINYTTGISQLSAHLAQDLPIKMSSEITKIVQKGNQEWEIHTKFSKFFSNLVVFALPAPQIHKILLNSDFN